MTPDKFIEYVRKDLEKSSIVLKLIPEKSIKADGVSVEGYFDETNLAVSIDKPVKEWLHIMVHEYSHFRQWVENCYAWNRVIIGGEDISDTLFLWIKRKKKFSLDTLKLHTSRIRDLELDCDRRAVNLLEEFKLTHIISQAEYISRSNSYLYFYNYALLRRRWWKRNHSPYHNPDVWTNFPPFFMKRYSQIPKRYVEVYDKYC